MGQVQYQLRYLHNLHFLNGSNMNRNQIQVRYFVTRLIIVIYCWIEFMLKFWRLELWNCYGLVCIVTMYMLPLVIWISTPKYLNVYPLLFNTCQWCLTLSNLFLYNRTFVQLQSMSNCLGLLCFFLPARGLRINGVYCTVFIHLVLN